MRCTSKHLGTNERCELNSGHEGKHKHHDVHWPQDPTLVEKARQLLDGPCTESVRKMLLRVIADEEQQ